MYGDAPRTHWQRIRTAAALTLHGGRAGTAMMIEFHGDKDLVSDIV
jgi:hypothetical protein